MTLKTLLEKYYLHDSAVINISFEQENRQLIFKIEFAFWMQEWYEPELPENGLAKLIFKNVYEYSGPIGNLDWLSIISVQENSPDVLFILLEDDLNDKFYEISFKTSSAEFVDLGIDTTDL